jgi:pimeloyl-ACP methyl ester carboxylesterase
VLLVAGVNLQAQQHESRNPRGPLVLADQGYFYVGGDYFDGPTGKLMAGQMYVEYMIPQRVEHRYPVVMIHGGSQTGTNFDKTPDGREGWAEFFVREGYKVYVVDHPGRGRTPYQPDVYGSPIGLPVGAVSVQQNFTASELYNLFPQAVLHTQWPGGFGSGVMGRPAFDQFYASQVGGPPVVLTIEKLVKAAGVALLDKIGPAILMPHSQAGPPTWDIADARPNLVKAIVAVEPNGPPFYEEANIGPPNWFADGGLGRPWGINRLPLTFDPPVTNPADLHPTRQATPDAPDLVRCWLQAEPAHKLVNLAKIPIVVIGGEASFRAPVNHCTSKFLTQAGVENDFVRLENVGIHGNGHMMMLEMNSLAIAAFMARWIDDHVEKRGKEQREEH